jgi:poly(3-hydroxybutyrate) depolymerase
MLAVVAIVSTWLASFMPKNAEKYRHVQPVEYYLYVPKAYSADQEWPLFIGMHSIGGNGLDCWYLWQRFAEEEGFILLCPSVPWTNDYDKSLGETTVWSVITEIKKDYRIQQRMFLNGVLMGGLFAQDFACDYPGYVSGLSLLSTPEYVKHELFSEPIPMLIVIGGKEAEYSVVTSQIFANGLQSRGFDVEYVLLPDTKYAITLDELDWTIDLFRRTIGKEPR